MNKKTGLIALLSAAMISFSLGAGLQDGSSNQEALSLLQKERIKVLSFLVRNAEAEFESSDGTMINILDARLQLMEAKLDSSTTQQERLGVLNETLELHRKYESIAESRFNAGLGGIVEAKQAKASRIGAEIELLKEKTQ